MFKILLVSHGTIAKGFYETMPMILGTSEDIACLCFDELQTVEQYQANMEKQILETWKDYEVLVLADMMNGTPSRIATQVIAQHTGDGNVICGMNLHLLLDAYMKRTQPLCEVVKSIVEAGKPSFITMNNSFHEENE